MKWISVKDKLPKSGDDVLLCDKFKTIVLGYRWRNSIYAFDGWTDLSDGYFTHWMELPKPPKEAK